MNQEQNNLNPNNFNTQNNNNIPNTQPLNNQNIGQNVNVNQPTLNPQPQPTQMVQQPVTQEPIPQVQAPLKEQSITNQNVEQITNINQPVPNPQPEPIQTVQQPEPTPQVEVPIPEQPILNTLENETANNQNTDNNHPKSKKKLGLIMAIIISIAIIVVGILFGSKLLLKNDKANNKEIKQENNSKEEKKESTVDVENWGVQEKKVTEKNGVMSSAYIKFPQLAGIVRGTGKIAYQKTKTLVILDSEKLSGSPVLSDDSYENVFPAYFEQTKFIMDSYRQLDYDNFEFSVDNKEKVSVNDYEMCKYYGTHTFTKKDLNSGVVKNIEMKFVAYATQLKGNGAYVYWMVLDESEDQSLTKTIEEYADKMAYTLHE